MDKSTEKNPNRYPFSLDFLCFCANGSGEEHSITAKWQKIFTFVPLDFFRADARVVKW